MFPIETVLQRVFSFTHSSKSKRLIVCVRYLFSLFSMFLLRNLAKCHWRSNFINLSILQSVEVGMFSVGHATCTVVTVHLINLLSLTFGFNTVRFGRSGPWLQVCNINGINNEAAAAVGSNTVGCKRWITGYPGRTEQTVSKWMDHPACRSFVDQSEPLYHTRRHGRRGMTSLCPCVTCCHVTMPSLLQGRDLFTTQPDIYIHTL